GKLQEFGNGFKCDFGHALLSQGKGRYQPHPCEPASFHREPPWVILIRQIVRYQNERPRALSLGGLPGWCNPRPPTAWPFPMAATGFGPRACPLPLARLERPQPDERDVARRHRVHQAFSVACAPLRLRQDPSFWVPIEPQPPGAGSTLPRVLPP